MRFSNIPKDDPGAFEQHLREASPTTKKEKISGRKAKNAGYKDKVAVLKPVKMAAVLTASINKTSGNKSVSQGFLLFHHLASE